MWRARSPSCWQPRATASGGPSSQAHRRSTATPSRCPAGRSSGPRRDRRTESTSLLRSTTSTCWAPRWPGDRRAPLLQRVRASPGSRVRVRSGGSGFITAALRGERPTINGSGTISRDFVHVDDVWRPTSWRRPRRASGTDLQHGVGAPTTLDQLVAAVGAATGVPWNPSTLLPVSATSRRPGRTSRGRARSRDTRQLSRSRQGSLAPWPARAQPSA
jgi:hypothetical protein